MVNVEETPTARTGIVRRLSTDGTVLIAAGSIVAGLAAYAFQIIGGRALGEQAFAPVAAMLSVHSLLLAVLLTPVELLTVRATVLGDDERSTIGRSILGTVGACVLVMVGFTVLGRDRYLAGSMGYLPAGVAIVLTHAMFAVGRGRLAGAGRNVAYGMASAAASVARLALTVALVAYMAAALPLVWVVAVGPLVIFGFRIRTIDRPAGVPASRAGVARLMSGLVLAGAISESLVLLAPLVGGALESVSGRSEAVVSVLFVTFSLGRAPLVVSQNLASRLLAGLTRLVVAEDEAELRRWSRRLVLLALASALPAIAVGWWLGPWMVELLFGAGFVPSRAVAGLAAGASAVSAVAVLLNQVLVASGRTDRLAVAWALALLAATAGLVALPGGPALRVVAGVFIGEVVAVLAVGLMGELHEATDPRRYDVVKRMIDVVAASALLVVTLPVLIVAVAAIRLDTAGPALLRQQRIGRGGQSFGMWKLRTMTSEDHDDALTAYLRHVARLGPIRPVPDPDSPPLWNGADPRVTRVGRILRRLSLDELPNLVNVLVGQMTLVGPRPLVPDEAALLGEEAARRHDVRPGVTGLAQTHGRRAMSYADRAYFDIEYLRRRGPMLDLAILGRTVGAVIGVERPREDPTLSP